MVVRLTVPQLRKLPAETAIFWSLPSLRVVRRGGTGGDVCGRKFVRRVEDNIHGFRGARLSSRSMSRLNQKINMNLATSRNREVGGGFQVCVLDGGILERSWPVSYVTWKIAVLMQPFDYFQCLTPFDRGDRGSVFQDGLAAMYGIRLLQRLQARTEPRSPRLRSRSSDSRPGRPLSARKRKGKMLRRVTKSDQAWLSRKPLRA